MDPAMVGSRKLNIELEIIIQAGLLLLVGAIGVIIGYYLARLRLQGAGGIGREMYDQERNNRLVAETRLQELEKRESQIQSELIRLREDLTRSRTELATRERDYAALEEKLQTRQKELEETQTRLTEEFKNIANKILVDNSRKINQESGNAIELILKPFRENISRFEKKIDDTRVKQAEETATLKKQIGDLVQLNLTMSEEARNLTTALKGESKTRGTWGEMILEKILEVSGLIRGVNYTVQQTFRNDEKAGLKPDVVIHLPEEKNLIIDSKVSLVAYERYCNESDPAERDKLLKEHVRAVDKHIRDLKEKNYQNLYGIRSPDFVLMFLPLEPSLSLLLENDADFYSRAMESNVILVTASTLLATLRLVAGIWRQENQNRNALEIARQGGQLYDKFVNFTDDLLSLGVSLEGTRNHYEKALNKLSSGRGNLIRRAERLKELGARTSRSLSPALSWDGDDEEDES